MDLAQILLTPQNAAHRQYEALRAYLVERLPGPEVARRYGYTYGSLQQLVHQLLQTAVGIPVASCDFRTGQSLDKIGTQSFVLAVRSVLGREKDLSQIH